MTIKGTHSWWLKDDNELELYFPPTSVELILGLIPSAGMGHSHSMWNGQVSHNPLEFYYKLEWYTRRHEDGHDEKFSYETSSPSGYAKPAPPFSIWDPKMTSFKVVTRVWNTSTWFMIRANYWSG